MVICSPLGWNRVQPPSVPGELVAEADVGERPADHDLVVPAARAVGVEVLRSDALIDEPSSGRAVRRDRTRGRDVIGGDRVPELGETAGVRDVGERLRRSGHAVEERRPVHVGGGVVPLVAISTREHEAVPPLVAVVDRAVGVGEHVGPEGVADGLLHLRGRGPDVGEMHGGAVRVDADRVAGEVDVHGAGQRVGHDERRGGQVVHPHIGVDPAFEVAVPRQHRRQRQSFGRGRDRRVDGTGVADAGRAAEPDEVEPERFEGGEQPGPFVVVHDDREPGASEVFTHGLTSSPRSTAFRASSAAAIITAGLEVFVQLVMAAITTWPLSISHAVPSARVTVTGFEIRSPSWEGSAAGIGMTKRVPGSSSGGRWPGTSRPRRGR